MPCFGETHYNHVLRIIKFGNLSVRSVFWMLLEGLEKGREGKRLTKYWVSLLDIVVGYVMRGILCVTLDGQILTSMGFCGGCY